MSKIILAGDKTGGEETHDNVYEDTPINEEDFNEGFNDDPEFDEPNDLDDEDDDDF
jgi:hypothetical protein